LRVKRTILGLAIWALWCFGISSARGDGGVVRWSDDLGPWSVTILTSPNPLVCGEVEVSVLVQDRHGRLARDVEVKIAVTPAGAAQPRSPRRASADHGPNKLYQSALFQIATPGEAQIDVFLQHHKTAEQISLSVTVGPTPEGSVDMVAWLFWPVLPILLYSIRELRSLWKRGHPPDFAGMGDPLNL
jgi:hypothetical protein